MRFDFIGLFCGMEKNIFITTLINVGAGGTVPAVAPKRTGDSPGVINGFPVIGL